jgi:hypothetical protein
MKNKIAVYALLPVLGLGILGPGIASAMGFGWFGNVEPTEVAGRFQEMFEHKANILDTSAEEIKDAWATGKSMKDLMEEKGISEEDVQARMKEARITQLTNQLQVLVSQGVITQAQADSRLQVMQEHTENHGGKRGFRGFGGFGFGHLR